MYNKRKRGPPNVYAGFCNGNEVKQAIRRGVEEFCGDYSMNETDTMIHCAPILTQKLTDVGYMTS